MIDFTRIKSGEEFEFLCEDLLRAKGFGIADKVARGPEGGKDLIVSETVTDRTGHTEERKTLVQCKHYAHSGKAVGFNDVANWRDACDQYEVNRYLLICSTVPTEDLRKKFQATTKKGDYVATIWAWNDLERYLAGHSDVRECYFPAEEPAYQLAQDVGGWLRALGYEVVSGPERCDEGHVDLTVEVKLEVPLIGEVTQKVLVRCIEGEIKAGHVKTLAEDIKAADASKGQLITDRRVASTAQQHAAGLETVEVMTFDELIDATTRFDRYLDWLEAEVKRLGVDRMYVPLACTKEEFDPVTKQKIGESRYDERNGWMDGYIDRWVDDPAKEHISILGEFGTGKTWFALHYAWTALQRYREAKERGVERPRLPIVIPLRDYAKAVSVESLFSEFFFRKHEIPLPGYSAFEQLNRMGKLLLIFDGFDEMAAKVDRQEMINNFWRLAKVVVPGAKAILTCRTEHFPEAKEGRALLSAELQASTAKLTGEPPQFEVLELEKFDDDQIRQVLSLRAEPATVEQVMGSPQLLDLARRPVMTEFILEALPDIEAGKPVDLSRIYLYAVRRKMERDIKAERTFTSLADKLYFLCELSWEMLSTDQMSLNYRLFPDRLRRLFSHAVQEQKDLDHWHYDMMGQTMLTRNADGDYTPAHRSLLEFFVAYKFAAELGVLAPDFTELAQAQSHLDASTPLQDYAWSSYFRREVDEKGMVKPIPPLRGFVAEKVERLAGTVGQAPLTRAILDLMGNMLGPDKETVKARLLAAMEGTRDKTMKEVGATGGNVATLLVSYDPLALKGQDLHAANLSHADFRNADLTGCNVQHANLQHVQFRGTTLEDADLSNADLSNAQFVEMGVVNSVAFSPDGTMLASGGGDANVHVWDVATGAELSVLREHKGTLGKVCWGPNGSWIASSGDDRTVLLWDLEIEKSRAGIITGEELTQCSVSHDGALLATTGKPGIVRIWDIDAEVPAQVVQLDSGNEISLEAIFRSSDNACICSGRSGVIKIWDIANNEVIVERKCFEETGVFSLCLSPDEKSMAAGAYEGGLSLLDSKELREIWNLTYSSKIYIPVFSSDGKLLFASSEREGIIVVAVETGSNLASFPVNAFCLGISISPGDTLIVSGSGDATIKFWDARPFVTRSGEPHINMVEYTPPDLSGITDDPVTWPEWWQKCKIDVPEGMVPNPDFGKCLRTIEQKLNCQGLRLDGAKGLNAEAPTGEGTLDEWLVERGAILE